MPVELGILVRPSLLYLVHTQFLQCNQRILLPQIKGRRISED